MSKNLMNYKSAEFTKIFINIYLISQITTRNILSNIVKIMEKTGRYKRSTKTR